MMLNMAAATQNSKIGNIVVRPIVVYMMYIHALFCFVADKASVRKLRKGILPIPTFSVFKLTVIGASRLIFITAKYRAVFFLRVLSSRLWKKEKLAAKFTITRYLRLTTNRFVPAFFRAANCFGFRKTPFRNGEIRSAGSALNRDFVFFKLCVTMPRTENILSRFKLVRLYFKRNFAVRTISFHMQEYGSIKEFCL